QICGDQKPHSRTVLPRAQSQPPRAVSADDQTSTTDDRVPRIAYLDCFSGISGDMFLGALMDAGVPAELFQQTVAALNVGAALEIARVNRSGISATKVDVVIDGNTEAPREDNPHPFHHESEDVHGHPHSHEHPHNSGAQPVSRSLRQGGSAPHSHGRHLSEIRQLILKADISQSAKRTAIAIFEKLGAAEAKIHNVPIEKIH